jgi:hypothetical protein
MPKAAERARNNATEAEGQKRHDHRSTDRTDLEIFCEQDATIDLLQCIEITEVGKNMLDGTNMYDS